MPLQRGVAALPEAPPAFLAAPCRARLAAAAAGSATRQLPPPPARRNPAGHAAGQAPGQAGAGLSWLAGLGFALAAAAAAAPRRPRRRAAAAAAAYDENRDFGRPGAEASSSGKGKGKGKGRGGGAPPGKGQGKGEGRGPGRHFGNRGGDYPQPDDTRANASGMRGGDAWRGEEAGTSPAGAHWLRDQDSSGLRKKQPQEQAWPEGVSPYAPGEGYGSNVLPFAGVSPKSLADRRSPAGQREMYELFKNATDPRRIAKIEAMRARRNVENQTVPVPADLAAELQERGWIQAARANGCQVFIDKEETFERHGSSWTLVRLSGSKKEVQESTLTLMAGLAPRPVAALDA